MSDEHMIVKLTSTLSPNFESIKKDVSDFCSSKKNGNKNKLAHSYGDSICWKYGSVGAASALPGVIPGLGTAAQIGVESSSILADLALMLRWMGSMTYGIGMIYERDIQANFNQDFVKVLGMWCGVIKAAQKTTERIAQKVAVAQFKKVPGKIFQKINSKVGTTIVTKYGTKRGGVAIGKLVPFGAGAIVGGSFNLITMKAFKKAAINYFEFDETEELYMEV